MKIYYCEQFPEEISQHRLAYLLLERALEERGKEAEQAERGRGKEAEQAECRRGEEGKYRYERTSFGKPYLADCPQIQFNLSHCKCCVACGVGELPVGIDVEKRFPWKENLAKRICHPAEWKLLMEREDDKVREACFNLIWSRKESYLKCIGTGIRQDLRNFQVWFGTEAGTGHGTEKGTESGTEAAAKSGETAETCVRIAGENYQFMEFQTQEYTLVCCVQMERAKNTEKRSRTETKTEEESSAEEKAAESAVKVTVKKVEWQDFCVQ